MTGILKKIPGLSVLATGNLELGIHGIGADGLKDLTELMVRMSSVPVVNSTEAIERGLPMLEVNATTILIGNEWATMLIVRLHDHLVIARSQMQTPVATWEDAVLYRSDFSALADRTRQMLSNTLTRLCNEIHAVNPGLIRCEVDPTKKPFDYYAGPSAWDVYLREK